MTFFYTLTKQLLFMALVLAPLSLSAESEGEMVTHAAAHIGISYAITHVGHVVCKRALSVKKDNEWKCLVGSAVVAAAVGLAKEGLDAKNGASKKAIAKGLTEDAIGVGSASIMIRIDF